MNDFAADRRSPLRQFPGQRTPRLCDCVVEALRTRRYSPCTEEPHLHPLLPLVSQQHAPPRNGGDGRQPFPDALGSRRCDKAIQSKTR